MTEINKDKDTKQAQGNQHKQNGTIGIGHLSEAYYLLLNILSNLYETDLGLEAIKL